MGVFAAIVCDSWLLLHVHSWHAARASTALLSTNDTPRMSVHEQQQQASKAQPGKPSDANGITVTAGRGMLLESYKVSNLRSCRTALCTPMPVLGRIAEALLGQQDAVVVGHCASGFGKTNVILCTSLVRMTPCCVVS